MTKEFPTPVPAGDPTDYTQWALESSNIAKSDVYPGKINFRAFDQVTHAFLLLIIRCDRRLASIFGLRLERREHFERKNAGWRRPSCQPHQVDLHLRRFVPPMIINVSRDRQAPR